MSRYPVNPLCTPVWCATGAVLRRLAVASLFAAAMQATGSEQLFLENCAVCHQRDGQGIPKVYPSLVTSEVVRSGAVDMALVLLIGRGEMPSFKGALSSEDMASIINYVRNSWGNTGATIDAAKIDALQ